MDNLNFDFETLLPFAINAFTKVYGEEYHDIIKKRINNAVIISYYDIWGLSNYLLYIKKCKRREYAIKFLDKIGVDVKKYKKDSYIKPLDNELEVVLENYMYSSFLGFDDNIYYWVPLQAFKPNNDTSPKKILKNKIKIINYLLNNEHEQITEKNFDLFVGTEEYKQILKKIDEYNVVYEQLLLEYRKWEEQLTPYEELVKSEMQRKLEILKEKKISAFLDISSKLPVFLTDILSGKTVEERSNTIFGNLDISSTSIIESFSSDKMKKLKSKEVELYEKDFIVYDQVNYLKNIGVVDIVDEKITECESEEDVEKYLEFLNQDAIKKYIPSYGLINYITFIREKKYEEALKEYYLTRKDLILAKTKLGDNNYEYIYEQIKNKSVCIDSGGAIRSDNEFVSIMFYTIRSNDEGSLFHNFMHECGHIIDQSSKGSGFECYDDFKEGSIRNAYDNNYRKYEKFNETLNDIFTMEAVEILHNQEIYLIEPQKYTSLDTSNNNTSLLTKNLLRPLLSKFRQEVINAKVKSDRNELIRYIGNNNFEDLVDVVNKVDYLSRNGVISKIETSPDDDMVKEYFKQVERVKKIYINIDDYYKINVENLIFSPYGEIEKSR